MVTTSTVSKDKERRHLRSALKVWVYLGWAFVKTFTRKSKIMEPSNRGKKQNSRSNIVTLYVARVLEGSLTNIAFVCPSNPGIH